MTTTLAPAPTPSKKRPGDYVTEWRRRNPEKAREIKRRYWEKNRERLLAKAKEARKSDPKVRARARASKLKYLGYPPPTRPMPEACECCGRQKPRLNLDHCHDTGIFRGWLCARCNLGIGLLGDSAESIKRAIEYLTK